MQVERERNIFDMQVEREREVHLCMCQYLHLYMFVSIHRGMPMTICGSSGASLDRNGLRPARYFQLHVLWPRGP